MEKIYQITTPGACYGVVVLGGKVVAVAPIGYRIAKTSNFKWVVMLTQLAFNSKVVEVK